MKEEFLHFIWKFKYFNLSDLKLTNGESLEIIRSGSANQHAGPDFFDARLKIGNTKWAGNVEIHLKSSDWYRHQHENDPLYDQLILHVVWEDDRPVSRRDGSLIPTLILKGKVSRMMLEKYTEWKKNPKWVPCGKDLKAVSTVIKQQQIDRMLIARLEEKSRRIEEILALNQQDWEATLYHILAKYFGFKVNAVPFELLTASTPFSLLRKYQSKPKQLTALLFGQAGFLKAACKGSYPMSLKKEYEFLKNKHNLQAMDASAWKFMRMRPANFPTIRLAQFAELYSRHIHLFQKLKESGKLASLMELFQLETHSYWESHYRFDVPAARKTKKRLGKTSIELLMINAVIPVLFTYAAMHDKIEMKQKVLTYLQQLPLEKNRLIRGWSKYKMPMENAYDGQALIQLKNSLCDQKKCLNCGIGTQLLKNAIS